MLFRSEPTTGFDPDARRQFWDVIAGLRDLGTTVFLTTHYMDEAQVLADRVAVMRDGRVVSDTPVTDRLVATEEQKRLEEEQRAVQLAP